MTENINRGEIIKEITSFLEGSNNDVEYVVNVETNAKTNKAKCVIHGPDGHRIEEVQYTPFIYIKDLKEQGLRLFDDNKPYMLDKMDLYGIEFTRLETGNHERLKNGYCWKVTSTKSNNAIYDFFNDGGLYLREKLKDSDGNIVYDERGGRKQAKLKWKGLFFNVSLNEQFFISTGIRLFKGMQKYQEVHKLIFDIETTGLRYQHSRVFAIGVKDNKGFKKNLIAKKLNDDDAEKRLIRDFFNTIDYIKPAIITGYNSEDFDFEFLVGRANILGLDINKLPTSLDHTIKFKKRLRRENTTLKVGSATERYTSTNMWGYTIIDTMFASKKTKAIDSNIKNVRLKYIAKKLKVAKENRVYVDGGNIGKYYHENKIFIMNPDNSEYLQVPDNLQDTAENIYKLILFKKQNKINDKQYNDGRTQIIKGDLDFFNFLKEDAPKYGKYVFTTGKKIVDQYLYDDLQETEDVDDIYNQASFLLGKIVPTTFHRICTMGSATIWNLLMVTWSYENNLAIPVCDVNSGFSGGLSRCFKKGLIEDVGKIDFASLYPMLQLWLDIFPNFDITGVIKKMLIYMTTTRNIYKKLANSDDLSKEELDLLFAIGDVETFDKYKNGTITDADRKEYKIKQAPIKILNNSLFGALGSGVAFNWSDNVCAARITCSGRLSLRQAIKWFELYGLDPLLAVTDGINFGFPKTTNICIEDSKEWKTETALPIDEAWKYGDKTGVSALIEKFNQDIMESEWMSVDNDGEFLSCYNLKRINYALLEEKEGDDKKPYNKVKVVGNTIKSDTLSEYIEDFIDEGLKMVLEGRGEDFVNFYYDYAEKIFYKQIPLKKIATKKRIKNTIKQYINRGTDKNGRPKARQAHMEMIIAGRKKLAKELFLEKFESLDRKNPEKLAEEYGDKEIWKLIETYMPPEPELDSTVYYVNTGARKSHGDVKTTKDKETGKDIISINAELINVKDLEDNPEMTGKYNVEKYLEALNKRVNGLFDGFTEEVKNELMVKVVRKKKDKKEKVDLIMGEFTSDQLKLSSFELDNIEEAMYLEDMEIKFWNKTGYDPRKIWDGFKTPEDNPLDDEIYQHALDHINKQLVANGNKLAKTVNDVLEEGDLILYKNKRKYSLGIYKNNHVEMLRYNLDVPLTEKEIEYDRIEAEKKAKAKEELEVKKELEKKPVISTYSSLDDTTRETLYKEFISLVLDGSPMAAMDMGTLFQMMPEIQRDFMEWIDEKFNNNVEDEIVYEPD